MKQVLLVDDNRAILLGLATILRTQIENGNFLTAEDGLEALNIISSQDIHLIITDLNMPVMDGYELLSRIKSLYPEMPVIAMTADTEFDAVDGKLLSLGVSSFLRKPFSVEALMSAISTEFPNCRVGIA